MLHGGASVSVAFYADAGDEADALLLLLAEVVQWAGADGQYAALRACHEQRLGPAPYTGENGIYASCARSRRRWKTTFSSRA